MELQIYGLEGMLSSFGLSVCTVYMMLNIHVSIAHSFPLVVATTKKKKTKILIVFRGYWNCCRLMGTVQRSTALYILFGCRCSI